MVLIIIQTISALVRIKIKYFHIHYCYLKKESMLKSNWSTWELVDWSQWTSIGFSQTQKADRSLIFTQLLQIAPEVSLYVAMMSISCMKCIKISITAIYGERGKNSMNYLFIWIIADSSCRSSILYLLSKDLPTQSTNAKKNYTM